MVSEIHTLDTLFSPALQAMILRDKPIYHGEENLLELLVGFRIWRKLQNKNLGGRDLVWKFSIEQGFQGRRKKKLFGRRMKS